MEGSTEKVVCTAERLVLHSKTMSPDPIKNRISAIVDEGYDEENYAWHTDFDIDVYVNEVQEFIGFDLNSHSRRAKEEVGQSPKPGLFKRIFGLSSPKTTRKVEEKWIDGRCVVGKKLSSGIVFIVFLVDTSQKGDPEYEEEYRVFYFSSADDHPAENGLLYRYWMEEVNYTTPPKILQRAKDYLDDFPECRKDLVRRAIEICDKVAETN